MQHKLVFAADIVPTETNEQYFIEGDVAHLFGKEIIAYLASADFRCFNLEVALTDRKQTALYPGPYLMAKPETVHGIKKLDPSLLTIGNNHALDQGTDGLISTMNVLKEQGIPFTGAGHNLTEAYQPYILQFDDVKAGIFNCSEYEFAAATENSCGVNPYDPLVSFDLVKKLKAQTDIAIVLYHGGKEFYRYPTPQLQRICRKFVDSGADLVICQHSHCIGCEEVYHDAHIVYGQGNFLFDRNEDEYKRTGMFVECDLQESGTISVAYKPLVKQNECVRFPEEAEADRIIKEFRERSEQIQTPGFIEESYSKLADRFFERYVRKLICDKWLIRAVNKLSGGRFVKQFYDDPVVALQVLNIVSPENHSELFKQGLRNRGKRGTKQNS